jgi:plasmid stability protein
MATLTVRDLPDDAKHRFRQVAAAHGRSMEEHLRQLIISAGQDDAIAISGVRDVSQSFRHFKPATDPRAESRARIERLIELGRGLEDFELPPREVGTIKDVDFS